MKKWGGLAKTGWLWMFIGGAWAVWTLAALEAMAAGSDWSPLVERGDALAKQHHPAMALQEFQHADQISPGNVEILARISEQLGDLADTEHSEAKAHESLQFAQKAVEVDPKSSRAHLDLAIAYGKLTDYSDNRTKLEYSKLIRKEAETALLLDPANALAAHVLGRWHLGMVSLNPILKAVARLVYGEMPPGSMEKALRFLQQAVELEPASIPYRQSLAQAYSLNGEKQKAFAQWQQILRLPAKDKEEIAAQKEARAALHF